MGRAVSPLARPRFLAAPRTLVSCASWLVASRGIAPRHHFVSHSQRTRNLSPGFSVRNIARGKICNFLILASCVQWQIMPQLLLQTPARRRFTADLPRPEHGDEQWH